MNKLIIIFGKPGAGKDMVANELGARYKYHIYNCDADLPKNYKVTLAKNEVPTDKQRDQFFNTQLRSIKKLQLLHTTVLVNFVFTQNKHRVLLKRSFPHAQFILISTKREVIEERLKNHPRKGHVVSTEVALKIGDLFEKPTIPHTVINNNGSITNLMHQLHILNPKQS